MWEKAPDALEAEQVDGQRGSACNVKTIAVPSIESLKFDNKSIVQ